MARPDRVSKGRWSWVFFAYDLLDAEQRDHMSERLHEMHGTVKRLLGTAGE
jgi:hypothetical protein